MGCERGVVFLVDGPFCMKKLFWSSIARKSDCILVARER